VSGKRFGNASGAALIEFALAFPVFWLALFAIIDFSRLMFSMGLGAETTRRAARMASICSMDPSQHTLIRQKLRPFIEASGQIQSLGTDWLVISYQPAGCNAETCRFVSARLNQVSPVLAVPGVSSSITLPAYPVTLPREAMSNSVTGASNAACS